MVTFMKERNPKDLGSLELAYIGDAIYELLARQYIMNNNLTRVSALHKKNVKLVSAPAQAQAAKKVFETLEDEEKNVFKRGRNVKLNQIPKNCTVEEYCLATALEALFGYLYLNHNNERISFIFNACVTELSGS